MELLAPAGTREGFYAVLAQKPDVIYLGAGGLNARSAEAQFSLDDLPTLVREAAEQGTKIHFTLNVLIKDEEMEQALAIAQIAYEAGVAAFIVQDKGLMLALRRHFPDLVIHASTQCSVGTKEQIRELAELTVQRVVLARELTLEQIASLTDYAHQLGIEVEVFTHGATCMCVSGQCHMSFGIGGRSANHGECAQPCRRRYQIWQGEQLWRDFSATLSPKDLSYFPYLRELEEIGVDSLKIEGRLRNKEYQAQVTAIFMTALEEIHRGLPLAEIINADRERKLEIAFNRGGAFQAAFLKNRRDAGFLSPEQVNHQGYYLGSVSRFAPQKGSFYYTREEADYLPAAGSQISLKDISGKTVATAPVGLIRQTTSREVECKGFHPRILRQLRQPLTVWQQKQPHVSEETLRKAAAPQKQALHMTLRKADDHQHETNPTYILELRTTHRTLSFSSLDMTRPPQPTGSRIELARLKKQMAKLGNTPYELASFRVAFPAEEAPTWRISDLNALRREALEKLERQAPAERPSLAAGRVIPSLQPAEAVSCPAETRGAIKKILYLPHFQAGDDLTGINGRADELIVLPLEELALVYQQDASLTTIKEAFVDARPGAFLPLLKAWSLDRSIAATLLDLSQAGLAGIVSATTGSQELVRNVLAAVTSPHLQESLRNLSHFLWQGGQVINRKTFQFLADRGYRGIMLSPELSESEQTALAVACQDAAAEPILFSYGRLEAMFTRFCPLGYSQGVSGCGLCRRERNFRLVDEAGLSFPLTPKAYADCSLQIWDHQVRQIKLQAQGIRAFQFWDEKPTDMRAIVDHLSADTE